MRGRAPWWERFRFHYRQGRKIRFTVWTSLVRAWELAR